MHLGLMLSLGSTNGKITPALPPPFVSSLDQIFDLNAGGKTIVITGTGFQAGATVDIGGGAAGSVSVDSDTQITCTAPSHGSIELVDVTVTNPDAQFNTLEDGFSYLGSPVLFWDMGKEVTTSSGRITAINDQSSGNHDATTTAGKEPGYSATNAAYGNVPTCDFDASGSGTTLLAPDLGLGSAALSVVLVANSTNTNGRYLTSSDDTLQIRRLVSQVSMSGDGATFLAAGTAANANIIIAVFNGASSELNVSSNTPTTGAAGTHNITGLTHALGNSKNTPIALFDQMGSIAYVLVYGSGLTSGERAVINNVFSQLTGISVS